MNVYDFDGTIYNGDSTRDFLLYCMVRYPKTLIWVPRAVRALALYALGHLQKDETKEACLSVLRGIPDVNAECKAFWDEHICRVLPWYLERAADDDLIVSASPSFLLAGACARLGSPRLIATEVDAKTGRLLSHNCTGAEKVARLLAEVPNPQVDEFYSDSTSDEPLALMAKTAFLVRRGVVTPWPRR